MLAAHRRCSSRAVQAAPSCLLSCLLGVQLAAAQTAPLEPAPVAAAASSGRATTDPAVDALLFDIQRIVAAEADGGWLIEELEQSAIERDVMESVCRATPAVREQALRELERAAERAGDPEQLYERAGRELSGEVEEALSIHRRLGALRRGLARAEACPFWVSPEPEFRGLQSTRERWIVNFDTGGTAQVRRSRGEWAVGAGGFGRLLGGYTFTHVSLLAGIEFGGGALVEPNEEPTSLVVNYIPALPLLVRLHRDRWNVDFEAASVALFQASNTALSYGVRGGLTVGVSALRLRGVLPWVGLAVATEYHFANSARPEAWYVRGGLRVGGVWDP